jgi:hypothetical protein
MTTAILPTPERLTKSTRWLRPVTDQHSKRDYHRALNIVDRLLDSGAIEPHQHRAGDKFERHYLGAIGVDVRVGDDCADGPGDLDGIPPTTYHGEKMLEAKAAMTERQFRALVYVYEGEDQLANIGSALCNRRDRAQASAAATVLIEEAVTVLADLWGLSQRRAARGVAINR